MIVLDDMWSLKAWDGVHRFLPNNKNGSRIVITTRLTTLASTLSNSNSLGMELLDENDSWDLLLKIVFGGKGCCPFGFEDIGKKIGKNCKGLPLSIVVVGGLLAKSEQTIEYWENMEENLNEIVNLDDDERCFKTLYMSYKQLPVHLKPCFLYMGIYREDHMIRISTLVRLWVAEGFLKPVSGKRLEDAAREYIKDLSERNLIMIHKLGSIGTIRECKVHDLLRDLCLKEAQKEGLYIVSRGHEIEDGVSRIVRSSTMPSTIPEFGKIDVLSFAPDLARSLIVDLDEQKPTADFLRMLRIVGSETQPFPFIGDIHQLVNSRFFSFTIRETELLSTVCRIFWNLQTLIVRHLLNERITVPTDIWHMPNIRHLYINNLYLSDPPNDRDDIVLKNLQTLDMVRNFRCSEQVVKRIPNIRRLVLSYHEACDDDKFRLTNLARLGKLETLVCTFYESMCQINYPQSLKKLVIAAPRKSQHWQDTLDKIGALPLLQKLCLYYGTFEERRWETIEGQFRSLKHLSLAWCGGLQAWTTDASHFPRLEHLHLDGIPDLKEIPSDFGVIPTLKLIEMYRCSDSAIESAKRILEEQEALCGEEDTTLQIRVELQKDTSPAQESLRSRNFHSQFDVDYNCIDVDLNLDLDLDR